MSTSVLYRATPDLQVRSSGDGRTIFGIVVPYNVEATVDDGRGPYREMFAPGSLKRSAAERGHKVRLNVQHDLRHRLPVGRATLLEDQPGGLYGEFYVSDTRDGDDALTLARDGVVSFSVGFRGIRERRQNGVTVRLEAAIHEASLVGHPAYETAVVGGVRSADGLILPEYDRERRLRLFRLHTIGASAPHTPTRSTQ